MPHTRPPLDPIDLLIAQLTAAVIERDRQDYAIGIYVRSLRDAGVPWQTIARALGVSRQAATEKYGDERTR